MGDLGWKAVEWVTWGLYQPINFAAYGLVVLLSEGQPSDDDKEAFEADLHCGAE